MRKSFIKYIIRRQMELKSLSELGDFVHTSICVCELVTTSKLIILFACQFHASVNWQLILIGTASTRQECRTHPLSTENRDQTIYKEEARKHRKFKLTTKVSQTRISFQKRASIVLLHTIYEIESS